MSLLNKFGIQLWSVKDEIQKNGMAQTLEKVAKAGFTGVEFAGWADVPANEMKKILTDNGLDAIGSHTRFSDEGYLEEARKFSEYSAEIGAKYLIEPYQRMDTKDSVFALAEKCNKIGEIVTKAGLKFGYHNHNHEFVKYDGKFALDIFYENTDKNLVITELDLFWVAAGGLDPVEYMKTFGSRLELVHAKQVSKDGQNKNVDMDKGAIDFKTVFTYGNESGFVKYNILEREEFERGSLDSVADDCKYVFSL